VVIVEGEGAVFGVNLGHPIVTNGDFATRLFPNYFGQYMLLVLYIVAGSKPTETQIHTRRRSESAYIRQVHDNVIMYTSSRLHTRLPSNVRAQ